MYICFKWTHESGSWFFFSYYYINYIYFQIVILLLLHRIWILNFISNVFWGSLLSFVMYIKVVFSEAHLYKAHTFTISVTFRYTFFVLNIYLICLLYNIKHWGTVVLISMLLRLEFCLLYSVLFTQSHSKT